MYLASDKQGLLAQAPKEREEDTVWALEPREQGRSFSIRLHTPLPSALIPVAFGAKMLEKLQLSDRYCRN